MAVAQTAGASSALDESVRTHVRLAMLAASRGACLVLFPELSLTGYHLGFESADALEASDARLVPLQRVADDHEILVAAGAPVATSRGLHIGTLSFAPRTTPTTYLKEHLGESEVRTFAPGPGGDLLALADSEAAALAICADITHPDHASDAADRGATIYAASCLLSDEAYASDADHLRRYAGEHRMVVLMANYAPPVPDWAPAGRSAVWLSDGIRLACAPPNGEAVVVASRSTGRWTGDVVLPSE